MLLRQHAQELTRRFLAWEIRGRGRTLYPAPVSLEPPFRPFFHRAPASQELDDGRRHTLLSWLAESLSRREKALPPPGEEEPDPEPYHEGELAEFSLYLPREERITKDQAEGFLRFLLVLEHPLAWEISGEAGRIRYSVSVRERDCRALAAAAAAFLPGVALVEGAPRSSGSDEPLVTEFCLAEEFLVPLGTGLQPDPLLPLLSLFSQTKAGEVLSFQILFVPARRPWRDSLLRAVTTPAGEPFFSDFPKLTHYAEQKVSSPLFAACLRIAANAPSRDRRRELSRLAAGALANLGRDNKLLPLSDNPNAPEDFLLRRSHRTGMLLSLPELAALVHLPSSEIRLPGIERGQLKEKAPPSEALQEGVFLGEVSHDGRRSKVFLSEEARMRHVHLLGSSGSGKSTLLVSMILEDIAQGHGVGVVDPHGDLVDAVLSRLPESRVDDVILFDPADPEYAVGWNILSANSEAEKEMLASDLVAVFRRLSTSWGDQMTAVLANAILTFLESEEGGTLSDLRRFLSDPGFRKSFLATVRDPHAKDFWTTEYPLIKGKPEGSILTRLDTLLRNKLIRGVVTAREKPLDFRRAVDDGRVVLARLSQGAIGEENAALLGALLVSKVHQVCLLRQDQEERERRPFWLYLDEFHNLATPSMAALFSGARKYRLGVTVAHQNLYQLRSTVPEVERAVLANAYTRICFNLSVDEDARAMSQGFASFDADDLGNLGIGEAIVRIGRKEHDFCLRTVPPERGDPEALAARRRDLRARSLRKWGVPRQQPEPEPLQGGPPAEWQEPQAGSAPAAREAPPMTFGEPVLVKQTPQRPVPALQPEEPRLPGKGGAEHTYMQELIRRWAEEQGFRAVVEEQIAGTRESIDVALYRGETRIACEITVTTPLEYEARNVAKCLAAEFGWVTVVSLKKGRLQKLEKILSKSLSPEQYERVRLFTAEEFLSWLSELPAQEEIGTVGGYKVKVRYKAPEDARSKRVAEIVARSLNRLKGE